MQSGPASLQRWIEPFFNQITQEAKEGYIMPYYWTVEIYGGTRSRSKINWKLSDAAWNTLLHQIYGATLPSFQDKKGAAECAA